MSPKELAEKYQITVIPTFVNYGGGSYADDGVELVREKFYADLPEMTDHPTTAAPSPGIAAEYLTKVVEDADHIIGIHVPEKLSATLNAIRLGAEMAGLTEDRITFVDGLTLSMGIGNQAVIAAEMAQETDDVPKIVEAIERVRLNTQVYAMIDTMEFLKRSGRVSSVVAGVGSLLKIKPIVRVWDGEVLSHSRMRTLSKGVAKLEELVRDEAPLDRLTILNVSNRDGAEELKAKLSDVLPEDTRIIEAGPTLGTHIGPGALGAVTLSEKWRQ